MLDAVCQHAQNNETEQANAAQSYFRGHFESGLRRTNGHFGGTQALALVPVAMVEDARHGGRPALEFSHPIGQSGERAEHQERTVDTHVS